MGIWRLLSRASRLARRLTLVSARVGFYHSGVIRAVLGFCCLLPRERLMSLQFGDFELDRERRQLLRSGEAVPLEPRAYELLLLLVERRPKALSRAQIRDVVWPGTFISESTLGVTVNAIRQALGDDARKPRFIRTVHGFGYAFCGEVAGDEVGARGEEGRLTEPRRPYPGLSSFTEADAEIFFGREAEVEALWERLRRRRLLALIGPSGAGKTSFLRAGVIPARPEGWGAIVSTPGRSPMTGLAQALAPEVAGDAEAVKELLRFEDPDVALGLLSRWRHSVHEALLVVDQFEELFTLNHPPTQARFAQLLGRLAEEAGLHVLLSLRDDFLIRCHEHEALGPVFTADLTPLLALRGEGLRRALVAPAKKEGFSFEDDALVEEHGGRGGRRAGGAAAPGLCSRPSLGEAGPGDQAPHVEGVRGDRGRGRGPGPARRADAGADRPGPGAAGARALPEPGDRPADAGGGGAGGAAEHPAEPRGRGSGPGRAHRRAAADLVRGQADRGSF